MILAGGGFDRLKFDPVGTCHTFRSIEYFKGDEIALLIIIKDHTPFFLVTFRNDGILLEVEIPFLYVTETPIFPAGAVRSAPDFPQRP